MRYILSFFLGILVTISVASYANGGDSSVMLLVREIDQNVTTIIRDLRLMREACFLP